MDANDVLGILVTSIVLVIVVGSLMFLEGMAY